jgi:hypothetical protein
MRARRLDKPPTCHDSDLFGTGLPVNYASSKAEIGHAEPGTAVKLTNAAAPERARSRKLVTQYLQAP